MTRAQLLAHMRRIGACDEAVAWVEARRRRPAVLWEACPRADWLLWLAAASGVDRRAVVLAACACARTALVHVAFGEGRPLAAIEEAEGWAVGRGSIERVRRAAAAAASYDAADAAYAYAAAAADAAAYAAAAAASYDAADAAYAAYAYAAAAADAAAYAARGNILASMAPLVRGRITWAMVEAALEGGR